MNPYGPDGMYGAHDVEQAPTGVLLKELVDEAKFLVREEVQVVKKEIRADVREAAAGAGFLTAAGLVAYASFLFGAGAFVLLMGLVMPLWLATALVAVALSGGAVLLAIIGRSLFSQVGVEKTTRMMKENGRWASETMSRSQSSRRATA